VCTCKYASVATTQARSQPLPVLLSSSYGVSVKQGGCVATFGWCEATRGQQRTRGVFARPAASCCANNLAQTAQSSFNYSSYSVIDKVAASLACAAQTAGKQLCSNLLCCGESTWEAPLCVLQLCVITMS
jgi:hypothetical protein